MTERIEQELNEIKKSEKKVKNNKNKKQIETISGKSKNIKKKQTQSSLYFEYNKEINFLNLKQ